jgi:hypothetical protein
MSDSEKVVHVMVDLETTGNAAGCGILSIGATTFNHQGVRSREEFYVQIDPDSLHDFPADPETLRWWKEQSKEAYNAAWGGKTPLVKALQLFQQFCLEQKGEIILWGNGAAFDNVILAAGYDNCGIIKPWSYWNDRCYRTLKNLFPYVSAFQFEGEKHNALDDAVHQALHCEALLNWASRYKYEGGCNARSA